MIDYSTFVYHDLSSKNATYSVYTTSVHASKYASRDWVIRDKIHLPPFEGEELTNKIGKLCRKSMAKLEILMPPNEILISHTT